MFDLEFYPTPSHIIDLMCEGQNLTNKTILEPSAGAGHIVDYLKTYTSEILACEKNDSLREIIKSKCRVIGSDFFNVKSEDISHIDLIIMNPPFSNAAKHILHAYQIAPNGCKIISLCNYSNIKNPIGDSSRNLKAIINEKGTEQNIGPLFSNAERKTDVEIGLIILNKGEEGYKTEFEGFFLEDEEEPQGNGIMQYNFIRDVVNRYVEAVKIFDKQIEAAQQMNSICSTFFSSSLSMELKKDDAPIKRAEFKKDLQKNAWKFIFNKMNMNKYLTRSMKEDINKFVENQQNIPFTMRNIYKMLEIVYGTWEQNINKAILEVFEQITSKSHENRHNVKGWKTNLHYLIGKKFILPYQISPSKEYGYTSQTYNSLRNSYDGIIGDLEKALCFITSDDYDKIKGVNQSINRNVYGEYYESHFFKYKGFKNGNMHFEFKKEDVWALFNQRIAKIKGYPLFEHREQTAYQKRNAGKTGEERNNYDAPKKDAKVLFSIAI